MKIIAMTGLSLLMLACAMDGEPGEEIVTDETELPLAGPRPAFQLPFPCGQAWRMDSWGHAPALDMVREPNQVGTEGALLVAPAAGVVNQSFRHANAGNMIQIDHGGGWFTTYIHLQSRAVSVGQRVSQGQTIGRVGKDGATSNGHPHLHFELAIDANGDGRASWGAANTERVRPWFNGVEYGQSNGQTWRNTVSRNCGAPAAPPVQEAARANGDFNGDGREDIAAFYDYGNSTTRLWVWYGTASGLAAPTNRWEGGPNNWSMARSRFVSGDFDGDGRSDIGGFYDYGGDRTRLWVWRGASSGFTGPTVQWDSGAGNWSMTRSRFVAGDFDGDGRSDIGGFYDYGGATTRLWVWYGRSPGLTAPGIRWESGAGNWAVAQSRFVAGDFNGDGRSDIGCFYDYGSDTARLWIWSGTSTGVTTPAVKWESGANNWSMSRSRLVTGDLDGDGDVDIGGLYDYGNSTTRLWVWSGTSTGVTAPAVKWDGGPGNWSMARSRFVTGDFDGNGAADVGGFYDYGSDTIRLWVWYGRAAGLTAPAIKWDSGPNNWRMSLALFL